MERAAQACRKGDLTYISNLDKDTLQRLLGQRDEDGRTLLHAAAASGNLELLQLLAARGGGVSINAADDEDWTPLQSATSAGREEVIPALLDLGADVRHTNSGGRTALHYAHIVLAHTVLSAAVQASKGQVGIIQMLLRAGADVDAVDEYGSAPLHRALCEGGKARLEVKDRQGQTPLFVAAACGSKVVALYLLARGADPEAADREGETPLSAAASHPGLREAMVAVAKGEVSAEDLLE